MAFDVALARTRFPALGRDPDRVFLDGPAGTQVPDTVIAAIESTLADGISNIGGSFGPSTRALEIDGAARSAVADLLGASRPEEIVFGQNMTSLTMAASRAIASGWQPGDEVVVTSLDHDANVWPWRLAARDAGASVRLVHAEPGTGILRPDAVRAALSDRTRLVAVTMASNALGTIVDVAEICAAAIDVGAITYVDGVHFAPHGLIDVRRIGCDFLVVSAYKFFGPHVGALFGRHSTLSQIEPYRLGTGFDTPPYSWETGTQSFEALAGLAAAVDYLAGWGSGASRRAAIEMAMAELAMYERTLAARFLAGCAAIDGVEVYGLAGTEARVPTFSFDVEGVAPGDAANRLADLGIFAWAGSFYATGVIEALGKRESGGVVRIGFVHYNTMDEVDAALDALEDLSNG